LGIITGISLVEKNYLNSRRYYFIELHGFTPIGISMQAFKETYGTKIKKDALGKPRPKHYPLIPKRDGSISLAEGYLKEATKPLVEMIIDAIDSVDELQFDLNELDGRTDIPETTKKLMRDARCGQGSYRKDLDQVWNSKCAVFGYHTRELLRASHIKKWSDSSDKERIDPNNGILLSANLDALFDNGLISFDDLGSMLVSARIDEAERKRLNLSGKLSRAPWDALKKYLAYHRKEHKEKLVSEPASAGPRPSNTTYRF